MKRIGATQIIKKATVPGFGEGILKPEVVQSRSTFRSKFARAYELYELRGKEDGRDVDDWLQAESELAAVATKAAAQTT